MNKHALAALRPGDPLSAYLKAANATSDDLQFYVMGMVGAKDVPVTVRLTSENTLGRIDYLRDFTQAPVLGITIEMDVDRVVNAAPSLELVWKLGRNETWAGNIDDRLVLRVLLQRGKAICIELIDKAATYAGTAPPSPDFNVTAAFDVTQDWPLKLPASGRGRLWRDGWSLGLPPRLGPHAWPLSTVHGWPLRHAFTVRVPEEYRTRGPHRTAISVFVDDQLMELEALPPDIVSALRGGPAPVVPGLQDLLAHAAVYTEERVDMVDPGGVMWSLIWLDEAAFNGPLTRPPNLTANPLLASKTPPQWLTEPYRVTFDYNRLYDGWDQEILVDREHLDMALPLTLYPRKDDPNVGKPPRDRLEDCLKSGYVEAHTVLDPPVPWRRIRGMTHFGGTAFPVQPDMVPMSAQYIEMETGFAGLQLGDGNARIDLANPVVDTSSA